MARPAKTTATRIAIPMLPTPATIRPSFPRRGDTQAPARLTSPKEVCPSALAGVRPGGDVHLVALGVGERPPLGHVRVVGDAAAAASPASTRALAWSSGR